MRCLALVLVAGCGFTPTLIGTVTGDAADAPDAPDGTVGAAWPYKRALTIDNTTLGPLADFPLLVILSPSRIRYTAAGADLRFSDVAGNPLAYEIESWNTSDKSFVWVHVPAIADHATTTAWMYYGNAAATDAQTPAAVWDNNFVGVWHLVDAHDSTGHNASTNINNASATPGQIGGALAFGGGQYIDTMSTQYLAHWTIEAWIDATSASHLQSPGGTSIVAKFPDYLMLWDCNSAPFCQTVLYNDAVPQTHASGYSATAGGWTQIAATYDGTNLITYSNGTASAPVGATAAPDTTGQTAKIGIRNDLVGGFVGAIDEVRITNGARPIQYVVASARAGHDTYVTIGPEQAN